MLVCLTTFFIEVWIAKFRVRCEERSTEGCSIYWIIAQSLNICLKSRPEKTSDSNFFEQAVKQLYCHWILKLSIKKEVIIDLKAGCQSSDSVDLFAEVICIDSSNQGLIDACSMRHYVDFLTLLLQ